MEIKQITPTNQTDPKERSHDTRRRHTGRRLRVAVAGIAAAGILAATIGVVSARETPAVPGGTPVDQSAVASWASANGLQGMSPASLGAAPGSYVGTPVDQSSVADWARANGLHGLSPASVGPVGD